MGELALRRYRPADFEAVWDLHERGMRDAGTDPRELPDESDFEDLLGTYVEPGGEFLVGERDGEIVAMGALDLVDERTGELKRMRVAPEHQREGLGTALLEGLERAARERGLDRIVLETANRQDSAPFYEANGYTEVGRRKWRGYTLIELEKRLDGVGSTP